MCVFVCVFACCWCRCCFEDLVVMCVVMGGREGGEGDGCFSLIVQGFKMLRVMGL